MKLRNLLVACCLLPVVAFAQKNPIAIGWSPEQALKIKNITSVLASPDGAKVLYTVREAVMTEDRSEYINQVWLCNTDARPDDQVGRGSNAVQLTKGTLQHSVLY